MRRLIVLVFIVLAAIPGMSRGTGYSDLPGWVRKRVESIRATVPEPEGVDAWVLFQRTEFAYRGDGEIRKREYRIVKVNSDRAWREGWFMRQGLGKDVSVVTHLKGWHVNRKGELATLDEDYLATLDSDAGDAFSTSQASLAGFGGVGTGSLIAWESSESLKLVLSPVAVDELMGPYPKAWVELAWTTGGWFSGGRNAVPSMHLLHAEPWIKVLPSEKNSITVSQVPAWPDSWPGEAGERNLLPWVFIGFEDAKLDAPSLESWAKLGAWIAGRYEPFLNPLDLLHGHGSQGKAGLESLARWMASSLSYRQVYLNPNRGWMPVAATETARRRFGDCKDLAVTALAGARALGYPGVVAMARIQDGVIDPDEPVSTAAFNHAIAAIGLKEPMGFASEVEVPEGRFLLFDPTASSTPLGFLPQAHRGRRVLLCLPQGGRWVQVPDSAIEPARLSLTWKGSAEANGTVKGSLRIEEWGDRCGLRTLLAQEGPLALRAPLGQLLYLPVDARWRIQPPSDPGEGRPFTVNLDVELPRGLEAEGDHWRLRLPGPYPMPRDLGSFLESRALPYHWTADGSIDFHGSTTFPWTLQSGPGADAILKAPFGSIQTKASTQGQVLETDWTVTQKDMDAAAEAAPSLLRSAWASREAWSALLRSCSCVKRDTGTDPPAKGAAR